MNKSKHKASEKDLADGVISREIVQEVMKYGVSQHQIKKILKLLAFELEDNSMMRKLCDIIEGIESNTEKQALIIKE